MRRAVGLLWRTLAPATRADDDGSRGVRPGADDVEPLTDVWRDPEFLEGLWPLIEAEGMAPWLAVRLAALGLECPEPWQQHLTAAAAQAAAQGLILREESAALAHLLHAEGIPVAVLKGAARAWTDGPPLLRARHVADCDVLVPGPLVHRAVRCLLAAGYVRVGDGAPPGHWHADPLRGPRLTVEVHHAVDAEESATLVWDRVQARARPVPVDGATLLLPDVTELAWHALRHRLASPQSWLRFRTVADLASLLPLLDAPARATLRDRLATAPQDVCERLAPLVRCVGAFAGDPVARDLGFGDGPATPMREVLVWRLAELYKHDDPSSRRAQSGHLAPYFILGHPADTGPGPRSVPRRMLDAIAIAECRRVLEDQPAS